MDNFVFRNPTRILFGKGMEQQAGAQTALHAKKVLLHYGGGSVKKSGLYDTVVASLEAAGVSHVELGGVQPNPRLSLVHEGVRLCRENGVEMILAVGGGSVIDSAKAIAMGVPYEGDVWDFYAGKATLEKALPVATVLTIPAAGSESSDSTVITNEDGWLKRGFGSELVYPVFSILNPERMSTLPAFQVACGAADIMAHMMERYFTNSQHVETIDRIIESTLKTVIHNVPKFLADPQDYDAAAEIMWSGTLAHNNIMSTGRVGDWASHNIEHELSGIYDVAHGAGLATVFPAWMKYVYKHDVTRFAQYAERVWNVDVNHWDPEETAKEGIRRQVAFYRSIGLPVTLSELGAGTDRLEEMADKATAGDADTLGQFVKLRKADVVAILELARQA
jgi:alcohol dehydrogenase